MEKLYGTQHPEVLSAHLSLAYVLEEQNRLREALVHAKLGEALDEISPSVLLGPGSIQPKRSDYLQMKIDAARADQPGK